MGRKRRVTYETFLKCPSLPPKRPNVATGRIKANQVFALISIDITDKDVVSRYGRDHRADRVTPKSVAKIGQERPMPESVAIGDVVATVAIQVAA